MNIAERFKNAALIEIVSTVGIGAAYIVGMLAIFGVFPG